MSPPATSLAARAITAVPARGCAAIVSVVILAVALGPFAFHDSAAPGDDVLPGADLLSMLQKSITTDRLGATAASLGGSEGGVWAHVRSKVETTTAALREFVSRVAEDPVKHWKDHLKTALIEGLVTGALVLIFAALYRKLREPPKGPGEIVATNTWHYGLCECGDCGSCLMSFCCLIVRWADTVSQDKMKTPTNLGWSFWPALVTCVILLNVIGYISAGLSVTVLLGLQVYYRQKIREAFGLEPWQHLCSDILTWCCCSPCAAHQEARQVEHVRRDG